MESEVTRDRVPVTVIGSVHMDLIAAADRLPQPGESIGGATFTMRPGGKAGNQAAALVALGRPARVITALGDDLFGRILRQSLVERGIDPAGVTTDSVHPTGASTVFFADGDYCSMIAPGAAGMVTPSEVERLTPLITSAAALLGQLEIPLAPTVRAMEIARAAGVLTVLNPSPMPASASTLSTLLGLADVIVLNRVEAARLTHCDVSDRATALDAARRLALQLPDATIVVTLGPLGAVAGTSTAETSHSGFVVETRDPVGAGDALLAAIVHARLEGRTLADMLAFGCAAGAISVSATNTGARIPVADAIDAWIAARPST